MPRQDCWEGVVAAHLQEGVLSAADEVMPMQLSEALSPPHCVRSSSVPPRSPALPAASHLIALGLLNQSVYLNTTL